MPSRIYAEKTLNEIVDLCLESDIDADLNDLELIIQNEAGTYHLNYHGVTSQLWLSSPLSGAHHFTYQDNTWVSTRNPKATLWVILREEFQTPLFANI